MVSIAYQSIDNLDSVEPPHISYFLFRPPSCFKFMSRPSKARRETPITGKIAFPIPKALLRIYPHLHVPSGFMHSLRLDASASLGRVDAAADPQLRYDT